MPKQTIRAMLKHVTSMMLKHCSSNAINVRTNERNSRTTTKLEHQSHVGQRARGVARFRPLGHRNSPSAGAVRGPIADRQIAFGGQRAGIASAALLEAFNA